MAVTPIEFDAYSGTGNLDFKLYADGSDTILGDGDITNIAEQTNRKGLWVFTYSGTATGLHRVVAFTNVGATFIGTGYVNLANTTAIHKVEGSRALASIKDIDNLYNLLWGGDMSNVNGEAARSPVNALRLLRNKWSVESDVLTVTKEDDTTEAWTAPVTTNVNAEPITAIDPA